MHTLHSWKKFIITFGASLLISSLLLYLFVLIVDPYDSLPFSPRWQRAPMCSNQRFSYPMLAKRGEFDSAIFGTSTVRLMQPSILNNKFDANFVNLSMDSASFHEQYRLFNLFLKHHPAPKYIIFGIDVVWCDASKDVKKLAGRPFPEWLYDRNPWVHPFYMFDTNTLQQAIRQFGYITKKKKARFGLDGYANFLPQDSEYDLERAKKHLYEAKKVLTETVPDNYESELEIKPIAYMQDMLDKLPKTTHVIFVFVPYHHHHQPSEKTCNGAALKQCKSRFLNFAKTRNNVHIFDFMIKSDITLKDENYWDPLHYNLMVAKRLMDSLEEGMKNKKSALGGYVFYPKERISENKR